MSTWINIGVITRYELYHFPMSVRGDYIHAVIGYNNFSGLQRGRDADPLKSSYQKKKEKGNDPDLWIGATSFVDTMHRGRCLAKLSARQNIAKSHKRECTFDSHIIQIKKIKQTNSL